MKARHLTTQRIVFKTGSKIRKVENLGRNELKLLRLLENLVSV